MNTQDFIDRAIKVHGQNYVYDQVVYKNNHTPVKIVCPDHGVFSPTPSSHLIGSRCPKCAQALIAQKLSAKSRAAFVSKAQVVHAGKGYSYEQVVYINQTTPVKIVCPKHGVWEPLPLNFLRGAGCFWCGIERTTAAKHDSLASFVAKARATHGERYDYTDTKYVTSQIKCNVRCPAHGEFYLTPSSHVQGTGCPKCGFEHVAALRRMPRSVFEQRMKASMPDIDVSKANYAGYKKKLEVVCPVHGSFWKAPDHLFRGQGCPACVCTSKGEQQVADWIKSLGICIEQRNRILIAPFEIDIVVPALRLGIEFNGDYWHSIPISERNSRNKNYHRIKFEMARKAGYRLLTVREQDWNIRQDTVKHWLMHQLHKSPVLCGARECDTVLVQHREASAFYHDYHLQGSCAANSVHFGLRDSQGRLVALMSFSSSATDRKTKATDTLWLVRFALAGNVPGAASRLFRYACLTTKVLRVYSYSDRTYASGDIYARLGFDKEYSVAPDYQVWHRAYGIRHKTFWQRKRIPTRLKELGLDHAYDPATDPRTEFDMCDMLGCRHVWDAGKVRWCWTATASKFAGTSPASPHH